MFGISLTELFVVVVLAIILINPTEYPKVIARLRGFYRDIRQAYNAGLKELEELKKETGLSEESDKLKKDIEDADEQIKKIVGDDGELYDAYDISEFMDKNDKN